MTFRQTPAARLLVPLAPVLLLVAIAAVYEPPALLLAGPWLFALLWVVKRGGSAVQVSTAPSTAEAARRRLAVR
jgi:hypothetical protein